MKIPTHVSREWERIRELDRVAIPFIPTVGIDAAYRIALDRTPDFNGKAKPPRAKKQGELF